MLFDVSVLLSRARVHKGNPKYIENLPNTSFWLSLSKKYLTGFVALIFFFPSKLPVVVDLVTNARKAYNLCQNFPSAELRKLI